MSDDPRLGLSSASSFALDALCPGRQALLRCLTNVNEPVDEDAQRGTRLHTAWEKNSSDGLDSEDAEIWSRGVKLKKQVFDEWAASFGLKVAMPQPNEQRLFLHDEQGIPAASGQADCHWIGSKESSNAFTHGLVCDYKSLYATSLAPAEVNWQARLLAVLVAREYGLKHVRFAFLKAMFSRSDIVDYTEEDLTRAEWSCQQVLWEQRQEGSARRAGAHCRHCKAVTACPEAASWLTLPTVQIQAKNEAILTPTIAAQLVEQLSLHDCRRIWETTTARRNIEDAVKTRLKGIPSARLAEIGLKLGESTINRPITDVRRAVEFLKLAGIPDEQIWTAATLANGKLTTVIQEALGMSKKNAETWMRDKLAACITPVPKEAPLEHL
jgi:hypothetical protein